jgi:hypothetical protein
MLWLVVAFALFFLGLIGMAVGTFLNVFHYSGGAIVIWGLGVVCLLSAVVSFIVWTVRMSQIAGWSF